MATTRWSSVSSGPEAARAYQERLDARLREGADLDGEARFVTGLTAGPSRILDAGCGTGRIAATLSRWGHEVVGVDADGDMLEVARERDPGTRYVVADLSQIDLAGPPFDIVLLAGNVVPFLRDGTLDQVLARLVDHLAEGGQLVAGWSLPGHQPEGAADVSTEDYERAALAAGLELVRRHSSWGGDDLPGDGTYALIVHRLRR